jgi:hypothetical protein
MGVSAPTFERLRHRFETDQASGAGDPRRAEEGLTRALRAVGWGGTDVADAEEVAALLVPLVDACVSGHRQLAALARDVAETLRHAGPLLDGSLPPAAAYLPAAEDVLARYAADE